ncbi:hypothetical protein D3C76_1137980 [compost metagenome]
MLGQHLDLAEDQRQFAVARVLEVEAYAQVVLGFHLGHVGVVVAVHGVAVLDQGIECEYHVRGRYRLAVVEPRLGVQVEAHVAVVRRLLDLLGEQAVFGEGLVGGVEGKAVVDQADLVGGIALGDEGVEAVEAADAGEAQDAALRGIRVDPGEVLEVRRVFGGLVVEGDGVLGLGHDEAGQGQQQGATA